MTRAHALSLAAPVAQNKHYIAVACALEGLGAAFFILGSELGAQMLVRACDCRLARRCCGQQHCVASCQRP